MDSEAWVEPLNTFALRVARKWTYHDPAIAAEDVVQQTWLQVYPQLAALPTEEDRRRYISRALRNVAHRAHTRRQLFVSMPEDGYIPDPRDVEQAAIVNARLGAFVDAALAGDRTAAILLLLAELGPDEAARRLGVNRTTVSTHAHKWRQKHANEARRSIATAADADAIRRAHAAGATTRDLARRYAMTRNNVRAILRGESWKEVA